jgi:hypothetical protein
VLATASYLALITALAKASGIGHLLFPELGALGSVVFTDPRGSWARSPLLLAITPFLTALPGVLITRSLPYGPLALGITSWQYPLAILAGTGGLALLVILRPRIARGLRLTPAASAAGLGKASTSAAPSLRTWLPPLAIFLAGGLVLVEVLGSHLVLYPPLMVIAYEMLAQPQHCPWQGRGLAVLVVTGGAALAGWLLVQTLEVVPLATLLAVLATALLLHLTRLKCPPAYGLALLPFVIPTPPPTYALPTHTTHRPWDPSADAPHSLSLLSWWRPSGWEPAWPIAHVTSH